MNYTELVAAHEGLVAAWHEQSRLVQALTKAGKIADALDAQAELARLAGERDDAERNLIAVRNQRTVSHRAYLTTLKKTLVDQYGGQAKRLALTIAMLTEIDRRIGMPCPDSPALGRTFIAAWSNQKCTDSGGIVEHLTLPEYAAEASKALDALLEQQPMELAA